MDELVLYAYPFRSRAERVLWTLRELNLPHRVVRLDPRKGETRTAEFLQLNPSAKIPVLQHGQQVLTESLAIMEYLNDISPSQHLIPHGASDNYRFRQVLHYGLTEVEPYLWLADQATHLKHQYRWPGGTGAYALAQVAENMFTLWSWLDAEFIVGNQFSLADMYFYHLLEWAKRYAVQLPAHVDAYLIRMEARAAFPREMKSAS